MIWALIGVVAVAALLLGASSVLRQRTATRPAPVDPFALAEPWRRHVAATLGAKRRYTELVATTADGPIHDRLGDIGSRLDDAIDEAWQIAQRGNQLDGRIASLGTSSLRTRLERTNDPTQRASIESQLASATRIRTVRDDADARLRRLTTRLDEVVAQATEVSVGAAGTDALTSTVDGIVGELQALGQAIAELNPPTPPAG